MLTESEKALATEKRALMRRLAEIRVLEARHPPLSDSRIAQLREDRTGETIARGGAPDIDQLDRFEAMSVLDELAAWRMHKLSTDEKKALRALADATTDEKFKAAVEAIRRIAPSSKDAKEAST